MDGHRTIRTTSKETVSTFPGPGLMVKNIEILDYPVVPVDKNIRRSYVISPWVIFLPMGLALLVCTYLWNWLVPRFRDRVNASQHQNLSNKTVIATTPGSKAIITTVGNKTIVTSAEAPKTGNGSTTYTHRDTVLNSNQSW